MRRSFIRPIAWAIALAGILALGRGPAQAAEAPYAGTWKVIVATPFQTITLLLVKIEDKDGKPQATVLSVGLPNFKNAKIGSVAGDDKLLRLTIQANGRDFAFTVHNPKGEAPPKKLLGSVSIGSQHDFAELERSDLKELDADPRKNVVPHPAIKDFQTAMQKQDSKERETALKEILAKHTEGTLPYLVGMELATAMAKNGAADADVRAQADKVIKKASDYGMDMKENALQGLARSLLQTGKLPALALDFAQQAEKMLAKDAPPAQQAAVLKLVGSALRKSGKEAEAKEVAARIAKLDKRLDEEFAKNAVPFKPEPTPPRKSKSDRVVLVELFTGAQCPPCVSADVAFDAMLQSHKPTDIALLQYHLHIPGPDPLTNADSETRSQFYGVGGTPSVYVDGKESPPMGGYKQHGKERYETLQKAVAEQLEAMPLARLKVNADKAAGKINIHMEVSELKNPGESKRLHVVVVEEVVRYAGSNGQRLHHHVVRAFPGGAKGIELKEASAKQNLSVNLADLHKSLNDYLTQHKFDDDSRPLDLKHLKVVAFVQDEKTKEVLQATQAEIGEDKSETE